MQDRIALRRKVKRKTFVTEADLMRLEEATLRFFATPTTRITSEQTSGIYGVPIGALPGADEVATDSKAAASALPVKHENQTGGEKSIAPPRPAPSAR